MSQLFGANNLCIIFTPRPPSALVVPAGPGLLRLALVLVGVASAPVVGVDRRPREAPCLPEQRLLR